MNHIYKLLSDLSVGALNSVEYFMTPFKKKLNPSLLTLNIDWCTNSSWMDRLVSYKQLDLWTHSK